jgi:hypothetical protein
VRKNGDMTDTTEDEKLIAPDGQVEGAGKKLFWFGIATVFWVVGACLILLFAHGPVGCSGFLPCLEANEWGDFLAGIFAPVAFMWLVATVWIQSDELRAQRRELRLTRLEFRLNRSAIESQVLEAKRQAEFIGEQTKIIKEDAAERRSAKASIEFRELVSKFVQSAKDNSRTAEISCGGMTSPLFGNPTEGQVSDERYIAYHAGILMEIMNKFPPDASVTISPVHAFEAVFHFAYSAEEWSDQLQYVDRLAARASRLSDIVGVFCKIIERAPDLVHLQGHVDARDKRLMIESMTIELL